MVSPNVKSFRRERRRVEVVLRRALVDEEQGPDEHADGAGRARDAVRRDVPLRDEEPDAAEEEQHRSGVDRDDAHRHEA
jgi:hypothetical protein